MLKSQAEQLFRDAQQLYIAGEFDDALILLDQLEASFPNKKNILFAKARCLASTGDQKGAAALCGTILERWDAPRAQQLLNSVEQVASFESVEFPVEIDLDENLPAAFEPLPVERESRLRVSTVVLLLFGLAAVAGSVFAARQLTREPEGLRPFDQREVNRLAGARERARIAEARAPSVEPGLEIPEEVWRKTALDGLPDWKPGIYRGVPCPNAYYVTPRGRTLQRTIDVYIPMAYQERPEELFPVVLISNASGGAGFYKLEKWAERNDAIIVFINSSRNALYSTNWQAQDAALYTISISMRVDERMGFAIGTSGGAANSWEMVCRYPNNFVGLVMIAMGSGHNRCLIPQHVRVGYIHGQTDHNNPAIRQVIPRLRQSGNKVREKIVPGGHVMGPVKERERMLTWMLKDARQQHGVRTVSQVDW